MSFAVIDTDMLAPELKLLEWLVGLANRNILIDSAVIFLARYLVYVLAAGFFVYLYSERDSRRRWFVFISTALAVILSRGIVTEAIRFFYPRPRPFEVLDITPLLSAAPNNSFPSGHAAFLFALGMALWFFRRGWGNWYFILALVVGAARVFAGVHWPLDILGGAVIGIVSAVAVYFLLRPYAPAARAQTNVQTPA